jgi:hypothetical protein
LPEPSDEDQEQNQEPAALKAHTGAKHPVALRALACPTAGAPGRSPGIRQLLLSEEPQAP